MSEVSGFHGSRSSGKTRATRGAGSGRSSTRRRRCLRLQRPGDGGTQPGAGGGGGFVRAMVLFTLAVGGFLAFLMLNTAGDDRLGSRNLLEGTRSFYAAEAGLNQVLSDWGARKYDTLITSPGQTTDLGWTVLSGSRSRYHPVLLRLVASGPILVTVDGRSGAAREGLRTVSMLVIPG